jgi:multidrug efflux pump subunit AcrA (membrane-fusion protein)
MTISKGFYLPRQVFVLMIVGTLVSLGAGQVAGQPGKGRWGKGPPPAAVVVSPVVEKEIRSQIAAIATVEAQLSTTVSAESQGLVEEVPVKDGDRVEKGKTVLVRMKNSDRKIDLAEADAAYRRTVAQLAKLKRGLRKEEIGEVRAQLGERKALMTKYKRDLERAGELLRSKIINLSEYNRTESDYLAAKYQVQRLDQSLRIAQMGTRREDIAAQEAEGQRMKASLDRARDELEKTVIRAPVSGFITKKHIEVGQWIQRGGQVVDIINIDQVLVRTGIQEKDISHVKVGDRAQVTVDAFPGKTFEGKIRDLIPLADIASRTFPVKIEVANPKYQLKAGMFARVTLFYGPKHPVLMVPKDALSQLGLRAQVFVANKGKARLVPVKIGRVFDGYVEVLEGGLAKGDRVIVTGNESLQDRRPIMVRAIRTPEGKIVPMKASRPGGPPGSGKGWGGKPDGKAKQWSGRKGGPQQSSDSKKWGEQQGKDTRKPPESPPNSSK